jgi:hypothetical protein
MPSTKSCTSTNKCNGSCSDGSCPPTKKSKKEDGCYCRKCILEISNKNRKQTCLLIYNTECPLQNNLIKQKTHKTNLEKYGVLDPSVLPEFRNKMKITCLEKYGVDHYTKTKESKDKCKNNCLEKYGVDHYSKTQNFKEKVITTSLEKYGVDHYSKTQEFKEKVISTSLTKYGVNHPMQNKYISYNQSKKCYNLKHFIFPCGKIVQYQGYENFALTDLINEGYTSNDIITCRKDVPEIWYYDLNNNKHRYFADIFIPKINKIIEVKSKWTYNIKKDIIKLKANACIKDGFDYEIWIYNRENTELTIIEY